MDGRSGIKQLVDYSFSFVALALLSPILVIVGGLVYIKLGSPILFKQQRPGLHGKPFFLYKFRSMLDIQENQKHGTTDEDRLTPLGEFLRSTSLDELPELYNVLKGEMSLVGPRPLLMEYLPLYTPEQERRHDVKPGITGWAQINGRNTIDWEKKFALDVWYVDNHTFLLDLKICFLTLVKIFRRTGINQPGQVTVSKFQGSMSHDEKR